MEAVVPRPFATFLRQKRLTFLLPLLVLSFVLAVPCHISNGFVVALGAIPGIALCNLLMSFREPLIYVFDEKGIYIRGTDIGPALTGLNGVAPAYWVDWRRDALVEVELTHWKTLPALCLSTSKQRRGKIIPIERENVDEVVRYLSRQKGQESLSTSQPIK